MTNVMTNASLVSRAKEKTEAICRLHAIADYRLLGPGGWPAEEESAEAFSRTLRDLGLDEDMPGGQGIVTRFTPLGIELRADLMTVFAGCADPIQVPDILAYRGLIDWSEAEEVWEFPDSEFEQRLHSIVYRVYREFSGQSKLLN